MSSVSLWYDPKSWSNVIDALCNIGGAFGSQDLNGVLNSPVSIATRLYKDKVKRLDGKA